MSVKQLINSSTKCIHSVGWNYLSISKLQRYNGWSLGMDKEFHLTLYRVCDYLSMLRFKLNHVIKRGPTQQEKWKYNQLYLLTHF